MVLLCYKFKTQTQFLFLKTNRWKRNKTRERNYLSKCVGRGKQAIYMLRNTTDEKNVFFKNPCGCSTNRQGILVGLLWYYCFRFTILHLLWSITPFLTWNTMAKKAFSALTTRGTDLESMLALYWRISGICFLFLADPVCSPSGEGKELGIPWLQWPSGFTILKLPSLGKYIRFSKRHQNKAWDTCASFWQPLSQIFLREEQILPE